MTAERIHPTPEDMQDYSDSRDLPPLDNGLFDLGVAKFPSGVSIDDLNENTKRTLLTIIDDFEQSYLAAQEAGRYRLGAIKEQFLDLSAGLYSHAVNDLGALLNLNQRDANGGVPPQIMAWRNALRKEGSQWKERIETDDKPKPTFIPRDSYPIRKYQQVPSGKDASTGDYLHDDE